ncbi:MFS general substrate transporter [Pilatotrama ljubarskyi]|nr:MFS general substrate transporter [Pilatotrama ljubarskyi]
MPLSNVPAAEEDVVETKEPSECGTPGVSAYNSSRAAAVWTKMDIIVLLTLTVSYFLSSLDRSNIGNARIAGFRWKLQVKMTDKQYSMALAAALIMYTLVDVPSNLVVKAVGTRIMIPSMVVLWDIMCTFQEVVHNYTGLIVCMVFLGLFEGGLLPATVLQPQLRISIMFSATSLASAFSGLLAAAILKVDGEGLFTVLFGLSSYFMLPNDPTSSLLFSNEEKQLIRHALGQDGLLSSEGKDDTYTRQNFIRTFFQPHVLLVMAPLTEGSMLSGLAYFLPSIVAGLGYSGMKVQLMTVPFRSQRISVLTAFLADRLGGRGLNIVFFMAVALVGFSIFYASFVDHVRYGSLSLLMPRTYCIGPPLVIWMANNSAPLVRRATVLALLPVMTDLGSILSTWLFGDISPALRYTSATITLLVFQIGILLCAVANVLWLTKENRCKARMRATAVEGQRSVVGVEDESIWFEYVL